jgi:signal transduction histidine kinase
VPRDLLKTLLQVSTDARSAFLSRKVNVKLNFPKTDVWVMADGLLDEVFYNLLSNSIKYDDHDEVTIDVDVEVLQENEKNVARVRVTDRGSGIPDDLKEKVFTRGLKRMQKTERASLHKSKGAGMGLSLVKSLVDRYGGRIWIENRVYADHSMGSVFVVRLPMP